METGNRVWKMIALSVGMLVVMSCLLPGMIPLTPTPKMEKNTETVVEILNGGDWVPLYSLASERYTEEEIAHPGVIKYTATVTNDLPVYFSYGWCTTDEQVLQQNFEHITVALYLNEDKLGDNVVHVLSSTLTNGLVCADFGVLLLEWPAGTYILKSVASFDEKINDGMADYSAGDYVTEFTVMVKK
jgi:hypothetical protein